jgi:MFS family permease
MAPAGYRHGVLSPYVSLLRRPGTLRFSAAGFIQRLPMSMLGLGVVLFLTLRGEPYAIAGTVAASGALASAAVSPFVSRYVDRFTQHRVLPIAVLAAITFQVTFLVLVLEGAPVWTWYLSFALGEAFVPNVGSLIRARWVFVLDDAADVPTAFALESVLDEVVFVVGPMVATVLAVAWLSWGAIASSIALLALGTLWLVPQRATEPPAAGAEHHEGKAAARYAGVGLVFVVFVLAGGVFGSTEVSTTAFAAEHGIRSWTGALLACYALGSGAAGLVLGTLRPTRPLPHQLRLAVAAMALVSLPFPFVGTATALGLLAFLSGLTVAPTLITGMALVEQLVPATRLTEGLTVVMAGLTVGFALGTGLSGPLIDVRGASAGFLVMVGCSVTAAVIAALGTRRLDRAQAGVRGLASSGTAPTPPG